MNINDLISQALNDSLPAMSSDIQMFMVWGVGCLVAVLAVRLLGEALGLIGGKDEDEENSSIFKKKGDE